MLSGFAFARLVCLVLAHCEQPRACRSPDPRAVRSWQLRAAHFEWNVQCSPSEQPKLARVRKALPSDQCHLVVRSRPRCARRYHRTSAIRWAVNQSSHS